MDLNTTSPQTLSYFSSVLAQIYDFPESKYVAELRSISGISCLCGEISLVSGPKQDFLMRVLRMVLDDPRIIAKIVGYDRFAAESLFCGSKILAAASQYRGADSWVADGAKYSHWLALQLAQLSKIPPSMLDKAFKLGYAEDVFWVLLGAENWDKFIDAYKQLSTAPKRFILTQFLRIYSTFNPPVIATIWKELAFGPLDTMLRLALPYDLGVQRAAVIWPAEADLFAAVLPLLTDWGSKVAISQLSIDQQRGQTQLILGCASWLSDEQAKQVTRSLQFNEGVTAHLSADNEQSREMATIVGQVFSRKAGQNLDFDIQYTHKYFYAREELLELDKALDLIAEARDDTTAQKVDNMIDEFLVPAEPAHAPTLVDSDDEDEEEMPVLVYVRDLLEFLKSQDYLKHHTAMANGPQLIRRKAQFGEEVTQYSAQLLIVLAGITDKYNVANFSEQRQQLMEAILVADPRMGLEVARLLNGGDYSLYQRMSLMNALVGAARTLAEYKVEEFASELLPLPALHKAFYSEVDALTDSIQMKLITAGDTSGGDTRTFNGFSKVAAKYFFFPLARAPPNSYGSYTALLYRHWVRTLGLLVYFSFPCNDMGDMVAQLLRVLFAARESAPTSAFTCLLLLNDVAPVILTHHVEEISALCQWCGETWPQLQDEKDQKLGAAAYFRLSKLLQSFQDKLLRAAS